MLSWGMYFELDCLQMLTAVQHFRRWEVDARCLTPHALRVQW
jgi:hypothetical protein